MCQVPAAYGAQRSAAGGEGVMRIAAVSVAAADAVLRPAGHGNCSAPGAAWLELVPEITPSTIAQRANSDGRTSFMAPRFPISW